MKTLGLFLARLQPLMECDVALLEKACARYDHVLVLIAGAGRPARVRAPLSWSSIKNGLSAQTTASNWSALPLLDTLYDDATWVSHVRLCLDTCLDTLSWQDASVTLIGQSDSNARATLTLFPDWEKAMTRDRPNGINAYYAAGCPGLNPETKTRLLNTRDTLLDEQSRLEKAGDVLGYPVVLNTADAVITQSNHILLVKRDDGLLSIPGTHIAHTETGLDAALRVAKQKGGLDMPKGALMGRLSERQTFDHPERSERGRVRTEAFVFRLPASGRMESVKANKGQWVAFHACLPYLFFEDHYDICQALLRGIWCDQESLFDENTA